MRIFHISTSYGFRVYGLMGLGAINRESLLVIPYEHVQKTFSVFGGCDTNLFKAFDCTLIPTKFIMGGAGVRV